jgi:hypothetical protein
VPTQMSFLPSLGMLGFYELAAPYNRLISPSTQYRCEGVKSLQAAIAEGQDPLKTVYLDNGDTEANFKRDLQAGSSLITLSADQGLLVVVPSSSMIGVPRADGVVYRNTAITFAISAIPDTEDLSLLTNEVLEMLQHKFGIRAGAYVTAIGRAAVLTQDQHGAVQSARQALIDDGDSLIAKNLALQAIITAQAGKLTQLEDYITQHIPPGG